jgi:serine/threonine protein kinase
MSLTPGTHLGQYVIVSSLGAGGMGEVYRARDTKLNRDVAIKLLPATFAADAGRIARLRREAQMLASLNHQNVAQIYGFEDTAREAALVMELVEGETLAERLANGPLPPAETLAIARQIAEALEAAHAQGIVHRDLKPANIKIRPDGTVKLLDFGVAKAFDAAGAADWVSGDAPAATMTATGIIVGTAAYMSPEQARGKPIDKRSDIWAFGCVLYELLTARRAFEGKTMSDTLVSILERDVEWDRLPNNVPAAIQRMLRRTLEKDPRRRLHDIADARIEIEDALSTPVDATIDDGPQHRVRWIVIGAGVAAVVTTAILVALMPEGRSSSYVFRPVAAEEAAEVMPAWSPDGKSLVYAADTNGIRQVFVRSLASPVSTQLTKSSTNCGSPFWSYDGSRVFYTAGGHLWSIGPAGGQPQRAIENVGAAAQSRRGPAVAVVRGSAPNTTLWIAQGLDVPLQQYKTPPFPETFTRSYSVDFSPDGTKIAMLIEQQSGPSIIFELWVVPYPAGQPYRVPGLSQSIAPGALSATGIGAMDRIGWAADSRHIILQNKVAHESGSHLFVVNIETGAMRRVTTGTGEEWAPAVSPDGGRIAFVSGTNDFDLIQVSIDRGAVTPLMTTSRAEYAPAWSPAGNRLAYVTTKHGRPELWVRNQSDGWSAPVLKADIEGLPTWYGLERPAFSADGQKLVYGVVLGEKHVIWVSSVDGGRPVPIDTESADQHGPAWSPDGNWIAYKRLFNGRWEFVKAPLGGGAVVRLGEATPGGSDTAWSATGEWLAQLRVQTIEIVSADGHLHKVLKMSAPAGFGFSSDGSFLHALRRSTHGTWELARIDVRTAQEAPPLPIPLPDSTTLSGFTFHPDGKSFVTAKGTARFDIWLLDGFEPPRTSWFRFR